MTKYKLIYFNFRGRAEVARHLFDLAGQEFEDKRLSFDEWRSFKADFPFQQLPVLEVTEEQDGKTYRIAQSHAITRFLAQRFNLAGKNDIERAQCDMINEVRESGEFSKKIEAKIQNKQLFKHMNLDTIRDQENQSLTIGSSE